MQTFDLGLTATGTVISVDPRPVRTIAETQLAGQVAKDHQLVPDSVVIDVGTGTVGEDGQVTFQATARATQVAIVDAAALRTLVKGKTAAEARAALVPFGAAAVTLWPDWVATVTGVDARLTVTIEGANGAAAPGAAGSAGPSGSSQKPPPSSGARPSPSSPRNPGSPAASATAP